MWNRLLLPLLSSLVLLPALTLAQDADAEVVRFNFRFGFFDDDDTPETEVIKEDVEGVLCQTQYFLSHLVQNATGTKSVHAKATEIVWGYNELEDLPAHINFTIEFTDSAIEGDVNWVDDRILITEMEALGTAGLQKYIRDWVWIAEPVGDNFFSNANRMAFDGVKQAPVLGQLEEAECPETQAPSIAPSSSAAPTTAPTLFNETDPENNAGDNSTNPDGDGLDPEEGDDPNADPDADADEPTGEDEGGEDEDEDGDDEDGDDEDDRPDWPFGPNYNDVEDLKQMADFSLSFSMFQDHERPPTLPEINALMCQVNEFFTMELRRKLVDSTIQSKAVYIDSFFDSAGAGSAQEDIVVNFTSFSYYDDDEQNQVAVQDVFEAMKLSPSELKDMVENYVWKSEPEQENIFYNTESLGLNAGVGASPNTDAQLIEADGCILPPSDDESPPDGSSGPGSDGEGDETGGSGDGAVGDPNLGLGGDAQMTEITIDFRVSNLENIKTAAAIKASGLDESFPVFTNDMVTQLTKRDAARRRVLRNGRWLQVVAVPRSAEVTSVEEYPCPASALPDLTCHSASAKYDVLMTSDEDPNQIQTNYTDATQRAAGDGTYNDVLQRVDPETPLYIGTMTSKDDIPPGSRKRGYDGEPQEEDDGWFKWWYILLLLLLLLLCCLICLYCSMLGRKDEPTKETTTEEREVLVEEFEDEGDENKHRSAPTDEEELADDPDAGQMAPYDPNGAPPETGVLVPYDHQAAQKAHDDQAERERILSASERGEKTRKEKEGDDQEWEEDKVV